GGALVSIESGCVPTSKRLDLGSVDCRIGLASGCPRYSAEISAPGKFACRWRNNICRSAKDLAGVDRACNCSRLPCLPCAPISELLFGNFLEKNRLPAGCCGGRGSRPLWKKQSFVATPPGLRSHRPHRIYKVHPGAPRSAPAEGGLQIF